MIQSKEYIIHQIANDIKTHIGQKYKDKSNIDWGLYTGILGLIVFFVSLLFGEIITIM